MQTRRFLAGHPGAFIALLSLSGCVFPARSRPDWIPAQVDRRLALDMPTWQFVEPNGVRVLVVPDARSDLVRVDVRFAVGSIEDPPGKSGLAHLVEHLNFSIRVPGDHKASVSERLGEIALYTNAYTTLDSTHYQALASRDRLGDLIAIEAARHSTGCGGLDVEVFEREREVVRNEVRQRMGTAGTQITRLLLDALYPKNHPYHRVTGGSDEELAKLVLDDACAFLQGHYTPERMMVVVAGNVTLDEVRAATARHLATLPARPSLPTTSVPPARQVHQSLELEADVDIGSVFLVWPLPPQFSRDHLVTMLVARTLERAMRKKLLHEPYVSGVDVSRIGGVRAPALVVQVALDDMNRVQEILDRVWAMRTDAGRDLDPERFQVEKAQARVARIEEMESLAARADALSDFEQFHPQGGAVLGELQQLDSISYLEIRGRIESLLNPDKSVVLVVRPGNEKKATDRAVVRYSPKSHDDRQGRAPIDPDEARRPLPVNSAREQFPPAWRLELANGLDVILWPHGGWPVVRAELILPTGSAMEPVEQAGLARLVAEEMRPSIARVHPMDQWVTAEAIGSFLKQGIVYQSFVDDDWTVFRAVGVSSDADIVVQGLESIVRTGTFFPEDFGSHKSHLLKLLSHPRAQARIRYLLELNQSLYGVGHPYARSGIMTHETITQIGIAHAESFKDRLLYAQDAVLVVTGAFDPHVLEQHVRYAFDYWPSGLPTVRAIPPVAKRRQPMVIGLVGRDEPTLALQVVFPAAAGIDSRYPARLVLEEMLDIRMQVIRERLAASYGLSVSFSPAIGPGQWVVEGELDAARAGEAIMAIRQELAGLRAKDAEFLSDFARARRAVVKKLLVENNSSEATMRKLSFLARFRLPLDYQSSLVQSVASLGPDAISALISDELDPQQEIMGLHGGREALERAFQVAGIQGIRFIE
ncbi:MAG: insulinase family protein [Deltaproteobacteria bacterium]|nr:insulinase family protein [Deltaproteobacteria bacterium]